MPTLPRPDILLTDIEGTTSAADFVHKVMFPYAHQAMDDYLARHARSPAVLVILHNAACTIADETGTRPDVAQTIATLKQWIEQDRKQTELKALQGLIWEEGYAKGDFVSHLYPDVQPALQQWHDMGITLGIYSSGSIHAQKLYFTHTPAGDLTPLFAHYFDTTSGGKKEMASYQNILQSLAYSDKPHKVMFLSDIEAELDAAAQAGITCIQLVRPGTPASSRHMGIDSFDQIQFAI